MKLVKDELPAPYRGQARVRVLAVSISDVNMRRGRYPGRSKPAGANTSRPSKVGAPWGRGASSCTACTPTSSITIESRPLSGAAVKARPP